MCESKVYLATEEGEQLVLEDVTAMHPEQEGYRLVNLFGEERHVKAQIEVIDLLKHRILLKPNP
jgi:predicted RNA-binding protein